MNSTFVTDLVRDITTTIAKSYAERLASEIDDGHQDGRLTIDILNESFANLLKELPVTPVVKPITPVVTTAVATKSAVASADALKDANGAPIPCSASTKAGAPCRNKAKIRVGDAYLCGLHAKSTLPNASGKPTVSAPPKGASQFSSIVGVQSNDFSCISIDADNVPDLSD